MTSRRRRNVEPAILAEIERLSFSEPRPTAAAILRQLESNKEFDRAQLPSIRTVQEIVKETAPPLDKSGRWTLGSSDDAHTPLVLPVLSVLVISTKGRRREFTMDEATAIIRVKQADPDIPNYVCWELARRYLARQARGDDTTDLDLYLSFAPWRGEDEDARYTRSVKAGWVPMIPGHLYFERTSMFSGDEQ